ncbi:hypothetical protein ABKN59_010585 [Abortiporus biennis]
MSSTTSATASASSSAAATLKAPGNLKVVGIILAITSGVLIGSSFVFKKKGLLRSQGVAGEGVGYLKSPLWWTGMIMMILGELCNFAAYAFVEAIVVTPMGALSVVICAILSSFFLKETLTFFGWLGCGLCIVGSVIIALNGPQEPSIGEITVFQGLFLSPGFLSYGSVLIAASLVIVIYFAPRYGSKNMLWYILVCSMIGGISVSVTTGLGSAIVTTAMGDNQFKHWFIYFLIVFIAVTLITEVFYLNKALALFNTAMVTPTYYVIFTFFSIITTIVLFKGLSAPVTQIITLVMGFVVICFGITILQLSKIDPTQIKLDRRSTILLQAARSQANPESGRMGDEKDAGLVSMIEDPGMDALRGSFGTIGSIVRAKSLKRMSTMSSQSNGTLRSRNSRAGGSGSDSPLPLTGRNAPDFLKGVKRHQLYDPPVPPLPSSSTSSPYSSDPSSSNPNSGFAAGSRGPGLPPNPRAGRGRTITFGTEDVVHSWGGDGSVVHERRSAAGGHEHGYGSEDVTGLDTPVSPLFGPGSVVSPLSQPQHSSQSQPLDDTLTYPGPLLSSLPHEEVHTAPASLTTTNFVTSPLASTSNYLYSDPFASTSALALNTYPSVSSTSTGGSRLRSPDESPTDIFKPLAANAASPPLRSTSPPSTSRHNIFGRASMSSSHGHGHRHYPKGDNQDDREESESLWRGRSVDEDSLDGGGGSVGVDVRGVNESATLGKEAFEEMGGSSIRLVPKRF